MSISKNQTLKIKELLISKIKKKLIKYSRETSSMPFLAKIMQDPEKVAAYSFIHSISTSLGMSIYEQISQIIAEKRFDISKTSYDLIGYINSKQSLLIS